MVAASRAVDRLTDSDTLPVPDTRSENMSDVSVRLSPLANVRIDRRARICVAGLTWRQYARASETPSGPLISTSTLAVRAPPASIASDIEVRCLAASLTVVAG